MLNKKDFDLLSAMAQGLQSTPEDWLFFCTMPGLPTWVRNNMLDEFRACPRSMCLTPRQKLDRVTEIFLGTEDESKNVIGELLIWAKEKDDFKLKGKEWGQDV